MLDAGETFLSEFIDYIVPKHNDPSVVYSTPSQPSLHSYFARPIVCCHVPDFVLTAEKVKKIIADTRRHVTDMVMGWERSGNGSNQLIDEEDSNGAIDYDLWGRFDRHHKIRRLDKLRGQRYLVFSTQCNTDSNEERAAAAAYVRELDETIATLQEEIDG